jgi:hypothetical protein
MAIFSGDLKLVKTQVMADVPEGGGAPTGVVVPDGTSNAIFPDVSELDRALGRVKLRKLAVHVDTANVDVYQGANVIISEPPDDPNISMTAFSTGETFDRRVEAVSRIEAYLSIGPQYPAYLYGNHIQHQDTLLIFQKTSNTPPIGATMVLTKREGFPDEFRQYVRVIEAAAEEREFEDDRGLFKRWVLTLRLGNTLAQDFPGFDMSRFDYTKAQIAQLTKLSDTVVANAARYYGVTRLEEPASIGAFTIKGESMFTQLVPSAQIETPIADARMNQLSAAVVSSGAAVVQSLNAIFSTTQSLSLGGAIAPSTLSIVADAISVTDSGGRLLSGGAEVGTIDYENGIAALTTDVFGTGGRTFTITYAPGATPQAVSQSQGFEVKTETRSLSYVRTIEPAPARGTLSISYMSQGRWYVLREQGDGAIRGQDSSFGAGNLNFDTGTVLVTFGALPDVGSFVIYQWVEPDAARSSEVLTLDNNGRFYWPFNTSGVSSLEAGAKAIKPGALSIAWNDGAPRSAQDDGAGNITGDATGTVNYARGTFRLSPNLLPAPGTPITVDVDTGAKTAATVSIVGGSGDLGVTGVTPGSISLDVTGQIKAIYQDNPVVNWGAATTYRIVDDAAGALVLLLGDSRLVVGSINYAAGTFSLTANTVIPTPVALVATAWDNVFLRQPGDFAGDIVVA